MEVAIYGEPGAYVGLAGMDRAFYTMQAPNQISLSKVLFFFNEATDEMKPNLIDFVLTASSILPIMLKSKYFIISVSPTNVPV